VELRGLAGEPGQALGVLRLRLAEEPPKVVLVSSRERADFGREMRPIVGGGAVDTQPDVHTSRAVFLDRGDARSKPHI